MAACPRAESKRGYDVEKPGSQDTDPIFGFKLAPHAVGYPGEGRAWSCVDPGWWTSLYWTGRPRSSPLSPLRAEGGILGRCRAPCFALGESGGTLDPKPEGGWGVSDPAQALRGSRSVPTKPLLGGGSWRGHRDVWP